MSALQVVGLTVVVLVAGTMAALVASAVAACMLSSKIDQAEEKRCG